MSNLSTEALAQYLASKSPKFQTSNGLSIDVNRDQISTEYKFEVGQEDFSFYLRKKTTLPNLLQGLGSKMDDLEDLGYNDIGFGTSTEKQIWRLPNWKSRKRLLISGCIK